MKANRGKWTPERRAASSARMRALRADPEIEERRRDRAAAAVLTEEYRNLMADIAQQRSSTTKARHRMACQDAWNDHRREKVSRAATETHRKRRANPEASQAFREAVRKGISKAGRARTNFATWKRHRDARGGKIPPGYESMYRKLTKRKVKAKDALRLVMERRERDMHRPQLRVGSTHGRQHSHSGSSI